MTRVCVVGGGTAGAEAAREAALAGAEVTLMDRSERPEPSWKSWPGLIDSRNDAENQVSPLRRLDGLRVATIFGSEVRSVLPGLAIATDGLSVSFDSVVVATGSGFQPSSFPGQRKSGVLVLDALSKYAELGRLRGSIAAVVVQGEGARALQVSERLCGSGRKVHVLSSCWQQEAPSPEVRAVLEEAVSERGVSVKMGSIEKAVGSGSLEAVVSGGRVEPCDALVLVPRRLPRVVPTVARLGPRGGLLVDCTLRASPPAAYAAGGCAELETGLPASTLESEAAASGRIAGANSTGQSFAMDSVRSSVVQVFGLRWSRAGAGPRAAAASGPAVGVVSRRWSPTSACTLVYETASGRVLGVEAVEGAEVSSADISAALSHSANLRTLAYHSGAGSSDISFSL